MNYHPVPTVLKKKPDGLQELNDEVVEANENEESDIDTNFDDDGVRFMLAEDDAGSNSDASEDDNSSETEWTKEVSNFPSSPLTAPFTGVSCGPAHDAPVSDFVDLFLDDSFFDVLASQ